MGDSAVISEHAHADALDAAFAASDGATNIEAACVAYLNSLRAIYGDFALEVSDLGERQSLDEVKTS